MWKDALIEDTQKLNKIILFTVAPPLFAPFFLYCASGYLHAWRAVVIFFVE
jgi:hypothetical protein